MGPRRRVSLKLLCLQLLYLSTSAAFLAPCEARSSRQTKNFPLAFKHPRRALNIPPYCVYPPPLTPTPPKYTPSSPVFLPPVVYPPPSIPPPPVHEGTLPGLWCVVKPTVPDPIIQEAMDYACGSGADCGAIQPGGSCYQPNTLIAHASFAFNSFWQRTKVTGGTCDFEGTAILITTDPSYDGCYFNIY